MITSTIELGVSKNLNIFGTYGDPLTTNSGIVIIPNNIYGKTNAISIENTNGNLNNKLNINTNI